MCFLISLLATLSITSAFPIGAEDPVAFTCEVRHQNSTLSPNWQQCQDTCKEVCDTAGSGARLQTCLRGLRYLGLGDCIYAFRQTIKIEPSKACVQQVSLNPPITKLIFELPAIVDSIVPRTSQPKGVQVIIETQENLCEPNINEAEITSDNFALEWVPASPHLSTSEPKLSSTPSPPSSHPTTFSNSDATHGVQQDSDLDAACDTLDLVEGNAVGITTAEIQYVSANRLSLDLLSWGYNAWRDVGYRESYLVLRSYNADCTFNTKHLKSTSFTLSQFGTVKVAQSSGHHLLHPWTLYVLFPMCTIFSLF